MSYHMWISIPNIRIPEVKTSLKDKIQNKITDIKENHKANKVDRNNKKLTHIERRDRFKKSMEDKIKNGIDLAQENLAEAKDDIKNAWDRVAMMWDLQVIDPGCCDDETMDGFIDDFISFDIVASTQDNNNSWKQKLGQRIVTALENGRKTIESVVDDKLWEHGMLLEISTKHPDILLALQDRVEARITWARLDINTGKKPSDDTRKLTKLQTRLQRRSDV